MVNPDASPATLSNPAFAVQHDGELCRISGTLDFSTARDALETVGEIIQSSPNLTINLAGIDNSNSAGLALLIEWLAQAQKLGHTLTYAAIPDSLQQLARVCQVDGLI